MGDKCEFESKVELRLKNHLMAEYDFGEHFSCVDCDFTEEERSVMIKHIETVQYSISKILQWKNTFRKSGNSG